jgi:hypothetical protein
MNLGTSEFQIEAWAIRGTLVDWRRIWCEFRPGMCPISLGLANVVERNRVGNLAKDILDKEWPLLREIAAFEFPINL